MTTFDSKLAAVLSSLLKGPPSEPKQAQLRRKFDGLRERVVDQQLLQDIDELFGEFAYLNFPEQFATARRILLLGGALIVRTRARAKLRCG